MRCIISIHMLYTSTQRAPKLTHVQSRHWYTAFSPTETYLLLYLLNLC